MGSPQVILEAPWRDPVRVAAAFADEPFSLALIAGDDPGWSYVARAPRRTLELGAERGDDGRAALADLLRAAPVPREGGPSFQGGLAGLASYEWGARLEPSTPQARAPGWPDLAVGLYDAVLAFDHAGRRLYACAPSTAEAEALLASAVAPEVETSPLAASWREVESPQAYVSAVAAVVEAIGAGEIFQANIARAWAGALAAGVTPFDVFARLTRLSPAPFAAYLRLPEREGRGRAVVSNSPERFVSVSPQGLVRAQPIKGTRPRDPDPVRDAALAAELSASEKDAAENRMIVDLMRNDLARACAPGSVRTPELMALASFANVHHLVSTVTGELAAGRTALDLFAQAFPPGSITGAPKVQAMRVIGRHEPPRGPYCGSMFWAGANGAFDSSVLIRTLTFEREAGCDWRFQARAGAGITTDSDPMAEADETEAKIAAIRRVLTDFRP